MERKALALLLLSLSTIVIVGLPDIRPASAQTFSRVGALTFQTAAETNLASSVIDPAAGFAYFGTDTGLVVKVRLSDFSRVDSLVLNSGENYLQSAVIDPASGFAYFGTGTSPGVVVKIRLSNFTRVGSLTLNSGENVLNTAVIDPAAGYAYFGTATSPGIVVKISLATFTRISSLTLNSGENILQSSVIDPVAGFAYFGTGTNPGIVVKVRLSTLTRVSALALNLGEDVLASAVVDPGRGFAYFGTSTSPGIVVKVGLSTFTRVANLTLSPAESYLSTGVIDPVPGFAYFGATGCPRQSGFGVCPTPGIIIKVRLSDFTRVASGAFNSGEIYLVSSVIDSAAGSVYFGTDPFTTDRFPAESRGFVVKVDLSTFSRAGATGLSPGETNVGSSVIDSAGGFAYFGTHTSPGVIVKVRLSNFTRVGSLVLYPGEDFLGPAVLDPAAGFAYFGGVINFGTVSPGFVVKVRLSNFTRVGSLVLDPSERWPSSAVIDSGAGFTYFGTGTGPGIVVKIRLSNFTRVGALTLNGGENAITTSVIDPTGVFAYFGTVGPPSVVVKVRLSDFTRLGSGALDDIPIGGMMDTAGSYWYLAGEGSIMKVRLPDLVEVESLPGISTGGGAPAIDTRAGFAYFGTNLGSNPNRIIRVRMSDLALDSTLSMDLSDYLQGGAVFDPATGFAYFTTIDGVVKVDVAAPPAFDFSMSSSGRITVLQGGSGSVSLATAVSRGPAQSVNLFCVASTLPKGASCSFNPSSVTPSGSSIVTVSTTSATPAGSFQVQVTSSPLGTTTLPAVFTLTVNPAILGLDQVVFYAIIGVLIAAVSVLAVSIPSRIRRRLLHRFRGMRNLPAEQ